MAALLQYKVVVLHVYMQAIGNSEDNLDEKLMYHPFISPLLIRLSFCIFHYQFE